MPAASKRGRATKEVSSSAGKQQDASATVSDMEFRRQLEAMMANRMPTMQLPPRAGDDDDDDDHNDGAAAAPIRVVKKKQQQQQPATADQVIPITSPVPRPVAREASIPALPRVVPRRTKGTASAPLDVAAALAADDDAPSAGHLATARRVVPNHPSATLDSALGASVANLGRTVELLQARVEGLIGETRQHHQHVHRLAERVVHGLSTSERMLQAAMYGDSHSHGGVPSVAAAESDDDEDIFAR